MQNDNKSQTTDNLINLQDIFHHFNIVRYLSVFAVTQADWQALNLRLTMTTVGQKQLFC